MNSGTVADSDQTCCSLPFLITELERRLVFSNWQKAKETLSAPCMLGNHLKSLFVCH
jgi:hypothetical protein